MLEARGLTRKFGQVTALDGADFDVDAGEVVALIGDNGAGKSTLVKALSGNLAVDSGEILFDGSPIELTSPTHGEPALGIETVYQDLALAPHLDPTQNMFLGPGDHAPGPRSGCSASWTTRRCAPRPAPPSTSSAPPCAA